MRPDEPESAAVCTATLLVVAGLRARRARRADLPVAHDAGAAGIHDARQVRVIVALALAGAGGAGLGCARGRFVPVGAPPAAAAAAVAEHGVGVGADGAVSKPAGVRLPGSA